MNENESARIADRPAGYPEAEPHDSLFQSSYGKDAAAADAPSTSVPAASDTAPTIDISSVPPRNFGGFKLALPGESITNFKYPADDHSVDGLTIEFDDRSSIRKIGNLTKVTTPKNAINMIDSSSSGPLSSITRLEDGTFRLPNAIASDGRVDDAVVEAAFNSRLGAFNEANQRGLELHGIDFNAIADENFGKIEPSLGSFDLGGLHIPDDGKWEGVKLIDENGRSAMRLGELTKVRDVSSTTVLNDGAAVNDPLTTIRRFDSGAYRLFGGATYNADGKLIIPSTLPDTAPPVPDFETVKSTYAKQLSKFTEYGDLVLERKAAAIPGEVKVVPSAFDVSFRGDEKEGVTYIDRQGNSYLRVGNIEKFEEGDGTVGLTDQSVGGLFKTIEKTKNGVYTVGLRTFDDAANVPDDVVQGFALRAKALDDSYYSMTGGRTGLEDVIERVAELDPLK